VANRLGERHRLEAVEAEATPFLAFAAPVERRFDAVRLDPCPAVRKPMIGPAIAPFFHEAQPFAVGDRPIR
jgi:hypothetical protein